MTVNQKDLLGEERRGSGSVGGRSERTRTWSGKRQNSEAYTVQLKEQGENQRKALCTARLLLVQLERGEREAQSTSWADSLTREREWGLARRPTPLAVAVETDASSAS